VPRRDDLELADALATMGRRVVDYHGSKVEFAEVLSSSPRLVVELTEGRDTLTEEEELILPRELRQEARELDKGDSVAVTEVSDGSYLVVNLISDTDAPEKASASSVADLEAAIAALEARVAALEDA
jgi:hypothetical protein